MGWDGIIWNDTMSGWWIQLLWKMMEWKSVGMMTFPTEWENKKCSKPPTSWVNDNISLTWVVRPTIGMISLKSTMIPGFGVEQASVVIKFTQWYIYHKPNSSTVPLSHLSLKTFGRWGDRILHCWSLQFWVSMGSGASVVAMMAATEVPWRCGLNWGTSALKKTQPLVHWTVHFKGVI